MKYNDDEPIVAIQSDDDRAALKVGKVDFVYDKNAKAPREECKLEFLVKLKVQGNPKDRIGVDIVTVLDVSGSMKEEGGDKLKKMKIAMKFAIKKLSPLHRLSVVTFAYNSARLCPLRQMTEESRADMEKLVDKLDADGGTNIAAGLQTGLQVLNDRQFTEGRSAAIILMSDGEQNVGGDATQADVSKFPVYTFGFGKKHDITLLSTIARKSNRGTYVAVEDPQEFNKKFSPTFAGLLTVAVQNLEMIIKPAKGKKIDKVSVGDYPPNPKDGSVTIPFGDLYADEKRKVIVYLSLPAVKDTKKKEVKDDLLTISATYSGEKGVRPRLVQVTRTDKYIDEKTRALIKEKARLGTAMLIKEARVLADNKQLEQARDKIRDAQTMLDKVGFEDPCVLIDNLKYEAFQLLALMKTQSLYDESGRPFALSAECSHDLQRMAARGDMEKLNLYSTPRQVAYIEQAMAFEKDPTKPPPTDDDDVKKEVAANPLAPIVGALRYHLQNAIDSLQSIDEILASTTP